MNPALDEWVYRARVMRLWDGEVRLYVLAPDECELPWEQHVTITVDAPLFDEDA